MNIILVVLITSVMRNVLIGLLMVMTNSNAMMRAVVM